MRAALTAVDPAMPVASEWTMREVMAISTMPQAISSILVTVFGALAAVLMVVGVFGVTSYAVTQRTREMGIRMALGASRAGVAALILRQSMIRVAAGLAIGIAGAFGISGLLRSMLFGVSPMDPLVYVLVIVLMFGIAAAATLIPARRATTVDPAVALKYE
jgi:ABC-type antimicrobial peptide transport system permease subunit